jgi:hypothetical protein
MNRIEQQAVPMASKLKQDQSAISTEDLPQTRIEASSGWVSLKLGELIAYRELLFFFVW